MKEGEKKRKRTRRIIKKRKRRKIKRKKSKPKEVQKPHHPTTAFPLLLKWLRSINEELGKTCLAIVPILIEICRFK